MKNCHTSWYLYLFISTDNDARLGCLTFSVSISSRNESALFATMVSSKRLERLSAFFFMNIYMVLLSGTSSSTTRSRKCFDSSARSEKVCLEILLVINCTKVTRSAQLRSIANRDELYGSGRWIRKR